MRVRGGTFDLRVKDFLVYDWERFMEGPEVRSNEIASMSSFSGNGTQESAGMQQDLVVDARNTVLKPVHHA